MNTTLAILLYLQVITAPGTYTNCEIYQDVTNHQGEITDIQNDPALYNSILTNYEEEEKYVIIIDNGCQPE